MKARKATVTGFLLLAVAAASAWGGSAGTAPTTSTPVAPSPYARQFLAVVTPLNRLAARDEESVNASAGIPAIGRALGPIGRALQTADARLLHDSWPATVEPGIRALVNTNTALIAALHQLSRARGAGEMSALGILEGLANKAETSENAVSRSLGLPASTGI